MTTRILAPIGPSFRAIAATVVPELATASPEVWTGVEEIVETALAGRPAPIARQLVVFIRLIGVASRVRFGRSLPGLDATRRLRLLRGFERSPLVLFRRGIWGLRTLVFMGYYTQPAVIASLGYRATPAGWQR
ncbi:MAG: hypothetical protein ACKVZ0_03340 [Gemmatimonadales bacterium]